MVPDFASWYNGAYSIHLVVALRDMMGSTVRDKTQYLDLPYINLSPPQ
jgi:hypothetical protein